MENPLCEFTEIERYLIHAPHVKDLGERPFPKDAYAAYAKVVLQAGDTLTKAVDTKIVAAMQNDGHDTAFTAAALSFSPNFQGISKELIIESFIMPIYSLVDPGKWKRCKTEQYLLDVFKVKKLSELRYPQDAYASYAKNFLAECDIITPDLDEKIIRYLDNKGMPHLEIVKIMCGSPLKYKMSMNDISREVSKALRKRRITILAVMIIILLIVFRPWNFFL